MTMLQVALIFKYRNFLSGILKIFNMVEVYHSTVYHSTNTFLGQCLYAYVVSHSFVSHGDPKLPNPGVQLHFNK